MGGGQRNQRQQQSQDTANQTSSSEQQKASELQGQLQARSDLIGTGLPGVMDSTRTAAQNLSDTGGIDESKTGYGTYTNMAMTGGFTPDQEQEFLRKSTAGTAATYGNISDQMNRSKSLQGGYSPGFDASAAKAARAGSQAIGEAGLSGNVALHQQETANKLAGAAGQTQVQQSEQAGKIAGQDALQKYSQFGISSLNQDDMTQLQNRLQSGQLSMADSQLLAQLASQDKTAFQNIMQGIQGIGGAAAGALTGAGAIGVHV